MEKGTKYGTSRKTSREVLSKVDRLFHVQSVWYRKSKIQMINSKDSHFQNRKETPLGSQVPTHEDRGILSVAHIRRRYSPAVGGSCAVMTEVRVAMAAARTRATMVAAQTALHWHATAITLVIYPPRRYPVQAPPIWSQECELSKATIKDWWQRNRAVVLLTFTRAGFIDWVFLAFVSVFSEWILKETWFWKSCKLENMGKFGHGSVVSLVWDFQIFSGSVPVCVQGR